MERKEIVNKINESLDRDINGYDGAVEVFDNCDADGEYIKINVFDVNVLAIRDFSIKRMTDTEIDHIGQMVRAAYMIGKFKYLEGQRAGIHEVLYHMRMED